MRITSVGTQVGQPIARTTPVVTRQDLDLSTPVPAVEKIEKADQVQKSNDRDLGRFVDITV